MCWELLGHVAVVATFQGEWDKRMEEPSMVWPGRKLLSAVLLGRLPEICGSLYPSQASLSSPSSTPRLPGCPLHE